MSALPVAPTIPAAWLDQLFGTAETGWLTLFSLDRTTGQRHTDWAPVDDIDALAATAERRATTSCVWFGVAPRRTQLPEGRRGGIDDCTHIPGFWLDIDIEGPGHRSGNRLAKDRPAAHALVAAFPLPPTVVIDSGGGLQAWWLFPELAEIDTDTAGHLAAWGATWNRLGAAAGIDVDNVFEIARVMRLPGTTNRKDGLARPVTIVTADWDRRYGFDDLDQHMDEAPAAPTHRTGSQTPYIGPERPGDAYNATHTTGDVLRAAGFTLARTHGNGEEHWCRPGKDARDGTSASVYPDDGHATIWSDTCTAQWPAIELRRPYDAYGLHTAINHAGNWAAATRALRAEGYGGPMQRDPDDDVTSLVGGPPAAPSPAAPAAAPLPTDPWPEPIPLGTDHDLPPFPIGILPDWIADYALEVAEELQVPVDLPATLGLGALSTLASGHVQLNAAGRWIEDLNLYLVIAMPPSTGKSPAYKAMCRPVHDVEKEHQHQMRAIVAANADMVDALEAELKRTKQLADVRPESLIEIRTRLYEAQDKPTTPPKLTVGDATPEALAKLIAENGGRMAVHSTEGGLFDLMAGRYSDRSNLDIYLQAWSGDKLDTSRIGRGSNEADKALLTVLITVQPSVIAALADNPELAGRGLTARFMYSVPPDTLGQRDLRLRPASIAPSHDLYGDQMRTLGRRFLSWQNPAVLTLDRDASDHYSDWRQSLEARRGRDGDLRPMAEWTGKLESSVLRVAGLLHMAHGGSHSDPVTLTTATRAIALGAYWLAHASHVHDLWGSSPDIAAARKVVDWIQAGQRHTFTVRDLYAANRATFKKADETIPSLLLLAERGWIRTVDGGAVTTQRNKRSVEFAVHPELSTVSARSARSVLREQKTMSLSFSAQKDEEANPRAERAERAEPEAPDDAAPSALAGSIWDLDAPATEEAP